MITALNTETALFVELLRGPGYGLDLIERVRVRGGGRIRLRQSVVYPTLRALYRRKLLVSWSVATPGRGRPRTYYDLGPRGVALAQAHREAIAGLAGTPISPRPTRRELARMRKRLFECGEVSAAATWLRRAGEAVRP